MNILLVEPDKLLADTYTRALQHDGYKVKMAPTAQAAIFAADERRPDLVLLEVQLVSHSGIEFLYEFRSYPEWQDIPVIIVSHVPPGEFADSWGLLKNELGVSAYRYKPRTSLRALLKIVDECAKVRG